MGKLDKVAERMGEKAKALAAALAGIRKQFGEGAIMAMGDGKQQTVQSTGNGPVDATFNAIIKLVPHKAKLALYQVHAVTEGTDAQAEVTVRLEEDGKTMNGQGADADTLVASARTYVNALNKLLVKRERAAPAGAAADVVTKGAVPA